MAISQSSVPKPGLPASGGTRSGAGVSCRIVSSSSAVNSTIERVRSFPSWEMVTVLDPKARPLCMTSTSISRAGSNAAPRAKIVSTVFTSLPG